MRTWCVITWADHNHDVSRAAQIRRENEKAQERQSDHVEILNRNYFADQCEFRTTYVIKSGGC